MAQHNNVRMESLFYSLNELKHEKLCLAQKLQELKSQRQGHEQDLEQVSSKCSQLQDKHRRFSETVAIAQQKVQEGLSSVQMIESKIGSNRPGRDCIQRAIDEQKVGRKDSLAEFETRLSSIASSLFTARDFHKEKALKDEIFTTETKCKNLDNKRDEFLKAKQSLTLRLNKLIADENACPADDDMEHLLKAVIGALDKDKQEMYAYLQRLKAELQGVHDALRNAQTTI